MEKDMNFNYSECIKSYDKIGETVYVNICNNEKTIVPWGISNWGVVILMTLLILVIILITIPFTTLIYRWCKGE